MKYISICSGIEAATAAWHESLGWVPLMFSEIEKFPCEVLTFHYPDVPNLGDMTLYREWPEDILAECDLLVAGCPCQAFSVAGLRNSLDDERGNLTLTLVHIINHIDHIREQYGKPPIIVLYENVPGILNTHDNAFGCFLAALAGEDDPLQPPGGRWTNAGSVSGPQRAISWRVLDAQYFGVAQRRRRVFVVASAGDRKRPGKILFERQGVRRDTPPSREKRQTAPTIPSRSTAGGGLGTDFDLDGGLIRVWPAEVGSTLNAHYGSKWGLEDQHALGGAALFVSGATHSLRGEGFDASEDGTGRGTPLVARHLHNMRQAAEGFGVLQQALHSFQEIQRPTLHQIPTTTQVRRLVVTECEFLQGFPRNYTNIKPNCPDGPRYKALGNSMCVSVMRWLGRRIEAEKRGLLK